jgi:hypothetical protein
MAMNSKPKRMHEVYAETGEAPEESDNFGVQPHNHTDKPHSEPKGGRKPLLKDHQRGIGKSIKYHPNRMPMQAAPDHGDHE